MNRFPLLASASVLLLLVACTPAEPRSLTGNIEGEPASSSVAFPDDRPIEPLPPAFTLPAFGAMRLSGTGLTFESVIEENSAYTRYAIHYLSNGLKISGIMNIPAGKGPFPLLILNHGYIAPSVYTRGRGLKREQDAFARAGFAVLHTDYRGFAGSDPSPLVEKVYDGNIEYAMDSANAILAVRAAALPQVDAEHVGMLGHSLGGGVTLAVLTARPDLVDAAVLYAPVHADVWENFVRWRSKREEGDRTLELYGTREENPAVWDALSPQTYLKNITAPVLLFQGGEDADVPREWSDQLAERMRALSKDFAYVEYPGEKHEFIAQWEDFMQKSVAFFRENP